MISCKLRRVYQRYCMVVCACVCSCVHIVRVCRNFVKLSSSFKLLFTHNKLVSLEHFVFLSSVPVRVNEQWSFRNISSNRKIRNPVCLLHMSHHWSSNTRLIISILSFNRLICCYHYSENCYFRIYLKVLCSPKSLKILVITTLWKRPLEIHRGLCYPCRILVIITCWLKLSYERSVKNTFEYIHTVVLIKECFRHLDIPNDEKT